MWASSLPNQFCQHRITVSCQLGTIFPFDHVQLHVQLIIFNYKSSDLHLAVHRAQLPAEVHASASRAPPSITGVLVMRLRVPAPPQGRLRSVPVQYATFYFKFLCIKMPSYNFTSLKIYTFNIDYIILTFGSLWWDTCFRILILNTPASHSFTSIWNKIVKTLATIHPVCILQVFVVKATLIKYLTIFHWWVSIMPVGNGFQSFQISFICLIASPLGLLTNSIYKSLMSFYS